MQEITGKKQQCGEKDSLVSHQQQQSHFNLLDAEQMNNI